LVDFAIINSQKGENSPFCVEFELYALGALIYFPGKITLAKFGNINYAQKLEFDVHEFEIQLVKFQKKYNSISAHAYLREK